MSDIDPNAQPSSSAAMPEPPTEPALPPPSEGVAFWTRVAARILDTVITMIVGGFVGFLVALVRRAFPVHDASPVDHAGARLATTLIASTAGMILFHALSESIAGGSPGKLLLGLRVISQDGKRASIGQTLIRSAAYLVDGFFFGMPAYTSMDATGAKNLRYGDRWANTMVVKAADFNDRVTVSISAMFGGLVVATAGKLVADMLGTFLF